MGRLGNRMAGALAAVAGAGPVAAAGCGWLVPPVVAGAVVPDVVPVSVC
ncbi:hypothetical protein [Mycolicibacterium sp. TY81]|nr:hypothetical protein [Mycolicibacterium sp. TY81]